MTIDDLRAELPGAVTLPGDEAFPQLSSSGHVVGAPRLVVRPDSTAGVASAVRFAASEGLPVSVRSGGHTPWGTNEDGLVVHLGALASIEVLEGGRVRIGGGAVWGDIATALAEHGLALTSGDTASVGVGGLTLGGGIGWLVRKHGLALDSLVGVELVTADARIVRADAETNADLFWALRGGGGNFGIVTEFEFQAHPLDGVVSGALDFDPAALPELLRVWSELQRSAPEDLTSTVMAMPAFGPEAPPSLQVVVVWAGTDLERARAVCAPLLAHPARTGGELELTAYRAVLEEAPPEMDGPMPPVVDESSLLRRLDDATIDAIVAAHRSFGSALLLLRSVGGAFSRVPSEATAFAPRDAEVLAVSAVFLAPDAPESAEAEARARWHDAVRSQLAGSYGNFRPVTSDEIVATIYPPETLARLREIKARWDPENLFRLNHNILPSGGAR